jgi:adenylate kinase
VLRVVYLKCRDEEEMIRRIQLRAIQENRADDTDVDIIRHRFDVYRQVTAPVLDFYEKELVADVEASGTPAEVLARILAAVIPAHTSCFR